MADIQANIGIGVDTTQALASIRQLQREISAFHTSMAKGGALANAESSRLSQNLVNTINAGGKFSASMTNISSSTESFTNALEKNKLSMGQYFRYAGGASQSFGKMFSREFNTINRVATERVKDLQTQYIAMGRDANGALQSIKVRPLALDMNNLGTKVQMVAQKQQLFNQVLRQGSTNLLNFGKNTQWAGRQLMVGFTLPLVMLGAAATREFQKIEEQAVKFKRVYGDMFNTNAETEKALDNVRQLAEEFTKYGVAVEKTIGLAAKAAQMGNTGDALTAQVTQATRLAVLGGIEQQEALDTTISLTNAFGVATEDLGSKIEFLNAAENQTILAIEDFNTAIPLSGSVVKQLGGNVEDLAVLLTAMREGGINASQAGNALKSSLARLIAPSRNAKETLSGFGIDVLGIVDNNAGNLMGTINTLAHSLNELDPLSRAKSIEALFGKFQFARMSTLFSNIVKEGSQASKVLGLTANSAAELAILAERELKRVEDSPAFKLSKQMEQLKAALAPIGAEFVKAILPIVEFGTKILKAFNNMGEGGKQFIVVLTAVAGVVAPAALMAFGLIANGVANLIKFFALLGKGFGVLSGQSRVLGTGTDYMTQQQLEAAAVAASLGQAHNNLIQIFSVEASAVQNLATAYRQAMIAQTSFRGSAASSRMNVPKPRGFANGGLIMGPGSGTSDSIPAMVSNGEFITNAKRTKQYLPLLQLISEGKVPGFASPTGGSLVGGSAGGSSRAFVSPDAGPSSVSAIEKIIAKLERDLGTEAVADGLSQLQGAVVKTAKDFSSLDVVSKMNEERNSSGTNFAHVGGSARSMPATEAAKLFSPDDNSAAARDARDLAEVMPDKNIDFKHSYGVSMREDLNRKLAYTGTDPSKAAGSQDVIDDWQSRGVEKWEETAATGGDGGLQNKDTLAIMAEQDKRMLDKLIAAREAGVEQFVDTQEQLDRMASDGIDVSGYAAMDTMDQQVFDDMQADSSISPAQRDRQAKVRKTALDTPRSFRMGKLSAAGGDLDAIEEAAASGSPAGQRLKDKFGVVQGQSGGLTAKKKTLEQNVKTGTVSLEEGRTQGEALTESIKQGASQEATTIIPAILDAGGWNSPHPEWVAQGTEDGQGYQDAFQTASGGISPTSGSLAPPPPPSVAYSSADPSAVGGIKGNLRKLGNRLGDSGPGKFVHKKLSQASGVAAADSQGNVFYDPNKDEKNVFGQMEAKNKKFKDGLPGGKDYSSNIPDVAGGAPLPVRVVDGFEMDPALQETFESGQVKTEHLSETMDKNRKSTDKNSESTKKAVQDTDRKQRKGALAGKMLGGLGTATMVAGMATQVEGKVGEAAQQMVGPLAALTGILPMLTALPLPIAALVAVIGAGVAIWYLYNKAMDKAYDKTYDLSRAMGSSTEAMNKFAEFAGTVTAGENMAKRREGRLSNYATAPGKQTFGSAYLESDSGQEFANSVRSSLTSLGKDQTVSMIFQQMGAAISQNILTAEQARSIVGNLGIELSNLSLSAEVNSQLVSVFGPNGENLLEEPLAIPAIMAEMQTDALTKSFEEYEKASALLSLTPEQYQQNFNGSSTGRPVASSSTRNSEYQDAIAAEKQRRIDSGEVEGWWAETMLRMTPDTTIANEMMQANLGQVSGNMQNSLESQQAIIDTMRVASEDRINKAIEEGADYSAIAALREEEADALDDAMSKIRGQTQTTVAFIEGLKAGDQETVRSQQKDRLLANAPEGTDKGALGKALNDLFSSGDFGANFTLSSAYEAGQLTLDQLMYLADLPPAQKDIYYNISTNLGAGEAAQIMQVAETIKDETVRQQFELSFDGLDGTELTDAIAMSEQLARISTLFSGDLSIPVGFMLKPENEEAMASFMANLDKITLDAAEGGWDKNIELVTSILGAEEVAAAQRGILANQAEFDALPDELQLQYGAYFTMFMDMVVEDGALLEMAEAATGLTGEDAVAAWIMDVMPAMSTDNSTFGETPDPTPTGSGAEKSVDGLITKLRDLRDATVSMKKGWEGMQETLNSIFAGGANQMGMFNGLEKQIRSLGIGEGLIAQIVGMDPDEYEKRKNELFEFDGLGNITKAKGDLLNMNAAFDAVAIGDYVNGQEQFIQKTKNQNSAIQTLVASGMSLADAYEAVQDEALAAAIAQGATREEIEEILRITGLAKEMEAQLEAQREKSRISESVRNTNEEFRNQVAVLKELSKAQGQYTDEQIKALMSDQDLQKLMLDPSIDSGALKEALRNAEQQANLEVSVNLLTKTGQETEFDKYLTEVNDYFTKKENAINVNFDLATAADNKLIEEAQNQLAAIQYELDDYNAELERISWQEDDINEKYDKRAEALDNVAKANERINSLQKAQLSIAEALSRGDISAAATAQQELASQQAKEAQERSKENLEKQRKLELGTVVGATGLTRKELEEEIQTLERKVFEIEETISEPAQERNRIAAIARDLAIEQLQLNEMTRAEFDQIAASTKEAAMNLEDMATSAEKLVALSEYIKTGEKSTDWEELFPTPKATPAPAPARSSSGGGSSAPAQTTDSNSGGNRGSDSDNTQTPSSSNTFTDSQLKSMTQTKTSSSLVAKKTAQMAAQSLATRSQQAKEAEVAARAAQAVQIWQNRSYPTNTTGVPIGQTRRGIGGMAMGGSVKGYPMGGLIPYKSEGGFFKSLGSDTVPAMLTPGEYVVRRPAVKNFGVKNLEDINRGTYGGESMYNYNLQVNVKSDSDPNKIANTVMRSIKQIEGQRLRGNRI